MAENENEEFFESKKEKKSLKKDEKGKSLFSRIMNVVLWIVLFVWMGICLIDFYKTHQQEDPMFCLKKETTTYKDGKVESCLGLGYKIYNYKRDSFTGIEYGPFWSKDRSEKENKEGESKEE